MNRRESPEIPAFASVGRAEEYPPTYPDSKRRHLFSTLSTENIHSRIVQYEKFQSDDKLWKSDRTLGMVALTLQHLRFEWQYRKGAEYLADWIELEKLESGDNLAVEDCPTVKLDTKALNDMLDEQE